MKFDSKYLFASCLLMLPCGSLFAKADIPTPQARAAVISNAEKLSSDRVFKYSIASDEIVNPFAPEKAVAKIDPKSKVPLSDHELLASLAAQLIPTGVLMMGDQSFLLFGEKKVKVGESIHITFDKDSYDVELVDLSRTAFTIKLNNEQTTRSIKPAKTP
ncbi:MAG TPA: hypothetical protein VFT72_03255 [Opitutaceae bacterium]|nr:hypothetical protein [Opitutaceae bacterium]